MGTNGAPLGKPVLRRQWLCRDKLVGVIEQINHSYCYSSEFSRFNKQAEHQRQCAPGPFHTRSPIPSLVSSLLLSATQLPIQTGWRHHLPLHSMWDRYRLEYHKWLQAQTQTKGTCSPMLVEGDRTQGALLMTSGEFCLTSQQCRSPVSIIFTSSRWESGSSFKKFRKVSKATLLVFVSDKASLSLFGYVLGFLLL